MAKRLTRYDILREKQKTEVIPLQTNIIKPKLNTKQTLSNESAELIASVLKGMMGSDGKNNEIK